MKKIRKKKRREVEEFSMEKALQMHVTACKTTCRAKRGNTACESCWTPHCCRQLISVDVMEALLICETCPQEVKAAMPKFAARASLENGAESSEFFDLNVHGCPFLVENRCSIYPVRPLSCALMAVAQGHGPEKCTSDSEVPFIMAPVDADIVRDMERVHQLQARAMKVKGGPVKGLSLAMLQALRILETK